MAVPITKKTLEKWDKELLALHKRVLKTELTIWNVKYSLKAKIFKLYDLLINEKNIREYFHMPVWLLIQGMVKGNLEDYRTLILHKPSKRRRKK